MVNSFEFFTESLETVVDTFLRFYDNVLRRKLTNMKLLDPTQKEIINEQKEYLKGKSFKYKLYYYKQYYIVPTIVILAIARTMRRTFFSSMPSRRPTPRNLNPISDWIQKNTR